MTDPRCEVWRQTSLHPEDIWRLTSLVPCSRAMHEQRHAAAWTRTTESTFWQTLRRLYHEPMQCTIGRPWYSEEGPREMLFGQNMIEFCMLTTCAIGSQQKSNSPILRSYSSLSPCHPLRKPKSWEITDNGGSGDDCTAKIQTRLRTLTVVLTLCPALAHTYKPYLT